MQVLSRHLHGRQQLGKAQRCLAVLDGDDCATLNGPTGQRRMDQLWLDRDAHCAVRPPSGQSGKPRATVCTTSALTTHLIRSPGTNTSVPMMA